MSLLRTALSLALCGSLAHPSVALGAMVASDGCEGAIQPDELPDVAGLSDDEKLEWAKKLYIEAKGFHDGGNYYCSVIKYEQAYTYAPDKHLFAYNLGVDAWELKDCARVKHYMQLFMVNDTDNDDLRKDAKRILDEAESNPECVTQGGGGGGSSSSGGAESEGSGAPIEDTEAAPGLDRPEENNGSSDTGAKKKKASGLMIGGVLLSVLGLGAAGGGVALTLAGKKKNDTLTDAASTSNPTGFPQGFYDKELADEAKSFGTIGPVLMGAGGALLVGGVVMIVLDLGNKKKGKGAYAKRDGFHLAGMGATPLRTGGGTASMTFRF